MAIVANDILVKLALPGAGPGDDAAQADPNDSLGGFVSTTEYGGALHDLFDVVTGVEDAASKVEYRCLFLHNSHASLTAQSCVIWVQSQVSGGAGIAIALDSTGATALASSGAQALTADDEEDTGTDLSGLTFATPTSQGTGLAIGDLANGEVHAIWLRRTAADNGPVDADGATLRLSLDTAE